MLDYTQFLDRYSSATDYLNPNMTEEGNVKPESDTITQINRPVVAEQPENQFVEQAEDLSLGVPPDQNIDGMQLAAATPVNRQRGAVTAPVAPEALPGETPMDTYIRTQESGGKTDIGYHYDAAPDGKRKSTAYGAYGITAPAYRDIQMADPYFRGRPIDSLSTTEQTRANQIYGKVQQAQLRNLGIEPTEENLRGAQLLGARGLKRYLENGTFSNEAARANGGAQNLERIVKARMGGQAAPSSQPNLPPQPEAPAAPQPEAPAAPPPMAGPGMDTQGFEGVQFEDLYKKEFEQLSASANDPASLSQLAFDKSMPDVIRRSAANQLQKVMGWEIAQSEAANIVANAQTDPRAAKEVSRAFNKSQNEGSWIRLAVFQAMGIQDGVTSELNKLGVNDQFVQTFVMQDGKAEPAIMRVKGNGEPVEGYTSKGKLTDKQLISAMTVKGSDVGKQPYKHRQTGELYFLRTTKNGQAQMVNTRGELYTGDTSQLYAYGIGSDLETKNQLQIQEFINNATYAPRLEGKKEQYRAAMALAEKTDPGDGSVIRSTIERLAQNDVIYDPKTKEFTIGPRAMQAAPAAPDQRQAPAAVPTQQPPAAAPAPAPVTQGPASQPGTISIPAADLRRRPGESFMAYEARLKDIERQQQANINLEQKRQEVPIAVNQKEQEKFIDTGKKVSDEAADAKVVAGARKRQIGVIKENPQVVGLMYGTGSEYDHARNYVLNLLNGYFDDPVKNKEKREALDLIGKNGLADAVAQLEADSLLINSKTIRDTAPVGAITDYEQNMNNKLNLGNITGGHPMAIANKFNQQLFASNLSLYKNKFLNDGSLSGKFKTDREFNQAWSIEESRLTKEYEGIYKARMEMIKPYEEALRKAEKENKDTSKLAEDRKKAIIHSMTVYPAPNYDAMTNTWNYGSDAARKVAKKTAMDNVLRGK